MYYKALLAALALLVQSYTHFRITSASVTSNITELSSLLAFKAAIEFDPNNVLANNWTSETIFCNWHGVSCSQRRQRVTGIKLFGMGLVGLISPHVGNFSFLKVLDLGKNSFHGQLIKELGHLHRLEVLLLDDNSLTGEIPTSFTTLPLRGLMLGQNNLTGKLPHSFGNMSTLQVLILGMNKFHGTIPNGLALLPRLTELNFWGNYLIGTIPRALFNSSLEILSLGHNSLTGVLPKNTGLQLPNLTKLFLTLNLLTGSIPSHFYNASKLTHLAIEWNSFTGTLPAALPLSLQSLSAAQNNLEGEIPNEIGNLKNLILLDLSANKLTGTIPPTIKGVENVQWLGLFHNELQGSIPEEICSLRNLAILFLGNNRLSGSIPECIGNLTGLQNLALDSSGLSSIIPLSLWSLDQLLVLDLSSNLLHGDLNQSFTNMKSLDSLILSHNQLSGKLPDFFGSFQSLTYLDISWNSFSGPIPESFGNLISLVSMNISNNNLSGQIPKSLEGLTYLNYLNLSYNNLSGEIPAEGPFVNFTLQSFTDNRELCGESISKSCPSHGLKKPRSKLFPLSYIVPIIVTVLIVVALFYFSCKHTKNSLHQNLGNPFQEQRRISYHELSQATNGFSDAHFLGSGGFGHVYKGILSDGKIVAVKLINLTVDGAIKSFDAECNVLRTVRHRNLVKVISTCTNPELRALILEYIPNGSLEKWLYSHNYCLSFLHRVSIMLDVAVALDYLHFGQSNPVIHCDLKPSNVLLDDDMVAHVGDFGISKFLASNGTETQTSTLGTFGYIAPEYGAEGRVSTKGDTYSYGIMLLETFTRRKPTDEMFTEELSFRQWVNSSVSNETTEIVDQNLILADAQGRSVKSAQNILLALLVLGLACSRDLPEDRLEMKDVVNKMNKIKLQIVFE